MKIQALIATAAILASSTVAMADSFTFQARASASFGASTRTPVQTVRTYTPAPVSYQTPYENPSIRDHRTPMYPTRDYRPVTPVAPVGVDCRNWDPVLERNSACSVFATGTARALRISSAWTALGSRESSVPDMQYITVERAFNQLWVAPIQGRPALSSVAIKFMDGTWQTVNLGSDFSRGEGELINIKGGARHQISQIVFHTATGSRGSYSAFAL